MTEEEMVGWHHRLDGHEFEQTPRDREGQRSLVCCSRWGRKELVTTEQMNNNSNKEKEKDRKVWLAAVHRGITKSQTRRSN